MILCAVMCSGCTAQHLNFDHAASFLPTSRVCTPAIDAVMKQQGMRSSAVTRVNVIAASLILPMAPAGHQTLLLALVAGDCQVLYSFTESAADCGKGKLT